MEKRKKGKKRKRKPDSLINRDDTRAHVRASAHVRIYFTNYVVKYIFHIARARAGASFDIACALINSVSLLRREFISRITRVNIYTRESVR